MCYPGGGGGGKRAHGKYIMRANASHMRLCNMHVDQSIGCFKSRATRLYTPLCRSVGRSVGPLFYFFGVFELFEHTAPAQML